MDETTDGACTVNEVSKSICDFKVYSLVVLIFSYQNNIIPHEFYYKTVFTPLSYILATKDNIRFSTVQSQPVTKCIRDFE